MATDSSMPEDIETTTFDVVFDLPGVTREIFWDLAMSTRFDVYMAAKSRFPRDIVEISRTTSENTFLETRVCDVSMDPAALAWLFTTLSSLPSSTIKYSSCHVKSVDSTYILSYRNVFKGEWAPIFPWLSGTSQLVADPQPHNPDRFINRIHLSLKVCAGWEGGNFLTNALGSAVNASTRKFMLKAFYEELQNVPAEFAEFVFIHASKETTQPPLDPQACPVASEERIPQ